MLTNGIPAEFVPEYSDWFIAVFGSDAQFQSHQAASEFIAEVTDLHDLVVVLPFDCVVGLQHKFIRTVDFHFGFLLDHQKRKRNTGKTKKQREKEQ